jgi:transposase
MFESLNQQLGEIEARLEEVEARLTAAHKANEVSLRLATIPGIRPITALTMGHRDRLGDVRVWSSPRRLGGPDAKGTFNRR